MLKTINNICDKRCIQIHSGTSKKYDSLVGRLLRFGAADNVFIDTSTLHWSYVPCFPIVNCRPKSNETKFLALT